MKSSNNIAVIDLGSNLTKLVIAKKELPLQVIHRSIYDTKTLKNAPKGAFDSRSIALMERDITEILKVTASFKCVSILGIATSAFRTRTNGPMVIEHLNSKFGTSIKIIEGQREAQLVFDGAMASVPDILKPVLVMDIGGGSTEFIIGNETEILWKHSFDLGSTAITKWTELLDPLTSNNLQLLNKNLETTLPSLFKAISKYNPVSFIGTTGAFESFAQMLASDKGNNRPVTSGYIFEPASLNKIISELIQSHSSERKNRKGIHPLRYDTIHLAAIIFKFIFQKTQFQTYALSLGDVKEGLIMDFLSSK